MEFWLEMEFPPSLEKGKVKVSVRAPIIPKIKVLKNTDSNS